MQTILSVVERKIIYLSVQGIVTADIVKMLELSVKS